MFFLCDSDCNKYIMVDGNIQKQAEINDTRAYLFVFCRILDWNYSCFDMVACFYTNETRSTFDGIALVSTRR